MLTVVMPILNQKESALVSLRSLIDNQSEKNQYILVDNGSNPSVKSWKLDNIFPDIDLSIIRFNQNMGLPYAMNTAKELSRYDYIYYTHSDIEMFEKGWDSICMGIINTLGSVGVAGFFGATGIGTPDIYFSEYRIDQMVRTGTISGNKCLINPSIHHQMTFNEEFRRCAVLDGFSLICKKDLDFWNESKHHMYDNDICMESLDKGFQNIVINLAINHYGGRTDVNEDWASVFGKTKQEIHYEAHKPFYDKWRSGNRNISLPYRI